MKTVSIGYTRDDGDFAILATLNNNDEHLSDSDFESLWREVKHRLFSRMRGTYKIEVLERQDTPDYVNIEE